MVGSKKRGVKDTLTYAHIPTKKIKRCTRLSQPHHSATVVDISVFKSRQRTKMCALKMAA